MMSHVTHNRDHVRSYCNTNMIHEWTTVGEFFTFLAKFSVKVFFLNKNFLFKTINPKISDFINLNLVTIEKKVMGVRTLELPSS